MAASLAGTGPQLRPCLKDLRPCRPGPRRNGIEAVNEAPATAQATIDVNGRIIRAEAAGRTMHDAIELMADRLRIRLRRTVRPRFAQRRRRPSSVAS